MTDQDTYEQACLDIIIHAGNGRAEAFQALNSAKDGDFEGAQRALAAAERELAEAHRAQTALIQQEAQGVRSGTSLLLAHALDQLMAAISERGLIEEMVELYRRLPGPACGG